LNGDPLAKQFVIENGRFLTNAEPAEIYQQTQNPTESESVTATEDLHQPASSTNQGSAKSAGNQAALSPEPHPAPPVGSLRGSTVPKDSLNSLSKQAAPVEKAAPAPTSIIVRSVNPQKELKPSNTSVSTILPAAAEFRQLIGNATSGAIARFIGNELTVIFWHRPPGNSGTIFGAKLNLGKFTDDFRQIVRPEYSLAQTICLALLDDKGKPVVTSAQGFVTDWKRPFVATEIGEVLPHWEIGVYLLDPAAMSQTAMTVRWTIGSMVGILLLAIGSGSWLIWRDIVRQVRLARQKTDFVSNVSHELKTPLTSIRMFSELLANSPDPGRQNQYSEIIADEASRLTRLINNVLDFTRMDRGETKYDQQIVDLNDLVITTVTSFRPDFKSNGIVLSLNQVPIFVRGNRDAIAQVLLNLLSNAEKYGAGEIRISTEPLIQGAVHVDDRGPGVPHGTEKKIFEQFFRAHDSLSSGVQGAGLGLTIARQIARANLGDVTYQPLRGGGSRFSIFLPLDESLQ
jgi:signal transduction histidine kinase